MLKVPFFKIATNIIKVEGCGLADFNRSLGIGNEDGN